jgi:hypothetical protein
LVLRWRKVFILCVALSLVLSFTGLAQAQDIKGHWAGPQITDWLNRGLCSGYPDGTFRPENSITRAEFITLVNKSFGFTGGAEVTLSDVSETDWFYGQVATALGAGYITGYEDNTMRPGKEIERQEVAVILARLLELNLEESGTAGFLDEGYIAAWSRDSIKAVVQAGLMKGYPDGNFGPQKPITRAEALVCLDRALKYELPVPEGKTGISGFVTREGAGVEDVTVTVFKAGESEDVAGVATDDQGFFELELPPGSYDLTAVAPDALAYANGVEVESGMAVIELVLTPGAVVTGKIIDNNNRAVAGAKVLYIVDNLTFSAVTGSDGTYTIVVLKNRKYTVQVYDPSKPDSKPTTIARHLSIGDSDELLVDSLKATFTTKATTGGGGGGGNGGVSMPEITALTVDVTEGSPSIKLSSRGTKGTVDFTSLPEAAKVTGGSVTVNRDCELVLTSETEKFPTELSTTQQLVKGVNKLDAISYLGMLDKEQDGISLLKLKEIFGETVDLYATLTDKNGRVSHLTYVMLLP